MANSLVPGSAIRSDLNTYVVRSVLGSGGFGITYSATYSAIVNGLPVQVVVAIKEFFLSQDCERDTMTGNVTVSNTGRERTEAAMKDFIGEANRLKSISGGHPNIIRVSEVFTANNTAYYVMEFVEGTSLDAYVKTHGPLTEAQTLTLMRPIIDATAFLHRNRITHLDIKPANIMISADFDGSTRPVLIDFGLSKHYDEDGQATSTINTMGHSEGYSPIEQYTGIRSFSPASDVYSLGATMYFCLTGQRPPVPSELNITDIDARLAARGITPSLRSAICSALNLRSADRPADAAVFLELLNRPGYRPNPVPRHKLDETTRIKDKPSYFERPTPKPEPTPIFVNLEEKPRHRRMWLWILIATLVVGMGVGAYFLLMKKEPVFERGVAYTFHADGSDDTFLIVPADHSEGYDRYLWCIKAVDDYWAPIAVGNPNRYDDDGTIQICFAPNSHIYWFNSDNSGFTMNAFESNGSDIEFNLVEDYNSTIRDNIFNYNDTFAGVPVYFEAANDRLAGTTWIVKDKDYESALEFGDIMVTLYNTDFYDWYQTTDSTPYFAYYEKGLTKLCFVSGDNPSDEILAGYIEGDTMYLHRTGIDEKKSRDSITLQRYYGDYTLPLDDRAR